MEGSLYFIWAASYFAALFALPAWLPGKLISFAYGRSPFWQGTIILSSFVAYLVSVYVLDSMIRKFFPVIQPPFWWG